ncbi:unnamed protein product [Paramecium primaurelia]|uniref:Uncharacterized protein n=1 Tax=Paramecium primaurelia TaxID=5886 RepID=A0A8S1N6K3_PARPR|nr:unnamed protein product [Paramecium primaurelia]
MGASICQQPCAINDQELIKEQLELQPKSFDSKRDRIQIQGQPIANQLQIKIQNASKLCYIHPDEPPSQEYSSMDAPEATTPCLPCRDQFNLKGEQQYIQLFNTEIIQSIKLQSQLVSSQNEDILQQFQQQQSNSSYPRFCNDEKGNKFLSMQIIDDNLDDYINYDWKNSKFQLISINDQNLLKKASSTRPKTKSQKKQF